MSRDVRQQIADLLHAAAGRFVSGNDLCVRLGISRTAIWKHVQGLRAEGAEIEAVPKKGYRLITAVDDWSAALLASALDAQFGAHPPFGAALQFFSIIDSTQRVAHEWAERGAIHGALVVAEQQTAGRGRMQRLWHSPPGRGIWLSFILRPDWPVHQTPHVTLLSCVALCEALRTACAVEVGIKWPNDLLYDGKKIAGLLVESVSEANRIRYLVLGAGINVNQTEQEFAPDVRALAGSLRMAAGDRRFIRTDLVCAWFAALQRWLTRYEQEGFSPVREQWCRYSVTLGRRVTVQTAHGPISGCAEAMDEYGALLIRLDDGTLYKNYSGELQGID